MKIETQVCDNIDPIEALLQPGISPDTSTSSKNKTSPKVPLPHNAYGDKSSYGQDKRKIERFPAKWWVTGVVGDKKIPFKGVTHDVSLNGCQLYTSMLFKSGDKAYIQIEAFVCGQLRTLDALVQFRHTSLAQNNFRGGVEFIKISKSNTNFIKACIKGANPHRKDGGGKRISGLRAEIL